MHKHLEYVLRCVQHLRSASLLLVRAKLSRLAGAPREFHAQKATHFVHVDSQRLQEFPSHAVTLFFSAPFQIALLCASLYSELGVSMIAGIAIMALFLPANAATG